VIPIFNGKDCQQPTNVAPVYHSLEENQIQECLVNYSLAQLCPTHSPWVALKVYVAQLKVSLLCVYNVMTT